MASVLRWLEEPKAKSSSTPAEPLSVCELPIKEPKAGPNRRFLPRLATHFLVHARDGGESMRGLDISFGGLMCLTGEPVWPGNIIDVDLELPDEAQLVRVIGRVVELVTYKNQIAMRIRFERVTPKDRKRIASWMARAYPKINAAK